MTKKHLNLAKVDHFCMNQVTFTPASNITVVDNSSTHIGEIVNICLDLSGSGTFTVGQPYVFGTISECFLPNCPSVEFGGQTTTGGDITSLVFVTISEDGTVTLIFTPATVTNPSVTIHGTYFAKQKCKWKKDCKKI